MLAFIICFILSCITVSVLAIIFMGAGMISGLKQLEHARFVETIDGKEEVRINLKLGPFVYTINIPESEGKDKEQ